MGGGFASVYSKPWRGMGVTDRTLLLHLAAEATRGRRRPQGPRDRAAAARTAPGASAAPCGTRFLRLAYRL